MTPDESKTNHDDEVARLTAELHAANETIEKLQGIIASLKSAILYLAPERGSRFLRDNLAAMETLFLKGEEAMDDLTRKKKLEDEMKETEGYEHDPTKLKWKEFSAQPLPPKTISQGYMVEQAMSKKGNRRTRQ